LFRNEVKHKSGRRQWPKKNSKEGASERKGSNGNSMLRFPSFDFDFEPVVSNTRDIEDSVEVAALAFAKRH